jgi:hypothetical protein
MFFCSNFFKISSAIGCFSRRRRSALFVENYTLKQNEKRLIAIIVLIEMAPEKI